MKAAIDFVKQYWLVIIILGVMAMVGVPAGLNIYRSAQAEKTVAACVDKYIADEFEDGSEGDAIAAICKTNIYHVRRGMEHRLNQPLSWLEAERLLRMQYNLRSRGYSDQ